MGDHECYVEKDPGGRSHGHFKVVQWRLCGWTEDHNSQSPS